MQISILTISLLTALTNALTITSPSSGDSIDPTQPITVQWTSSSSDPSTFDLILDNSNSNSLIKNKKVASSISTSSGSYVLSTATLMTYGSGFIFKAEDSTGALLATSGSFSLAIDGSAVTTSNGQVSFKSTYTATGAASSTGSDNSGESSVFAQTTGTDASSTGTATGTGTNGFLTSTMTRSSSSSGHSGSSTSGSTSSGTRSVSSSAASATTSANAQPRIGGSSSQIAFSAAGILAGLVALLA